VKMPSPKRRHQHAVNVAEAAARKVATAAAGPPRTDAEWKFLTGQVEQYGRALMVIRERLGQVCENYEVCDHRACQASHAAWEVADAALTGAELPPV
jgi:hypothetical protein